MTLKKSKVLMHAECIKLTSDVFEQRVPSRASDVLEGAEFCSGKTRPQADDDHHPRFFGWFCLLLTLFEQPISWHRDPLFPTLIEHEVARWWFRSWLKDKL